VDFDPGAGVHLMSGGPFILKLDANGDFVWSVTFDSGNGAGTDIVINGGEVYATGALYDDSDFDPMSCAAKVLGAAQNFYVWKLHEVNVPNPTISSFSPTSGNAGTEVIITGTNFSVIPADNVVTFNNQLAVVTASTVTTITTSVPAAATTGKIKVTVHCKSVTSAANFTVGAPALPTITSFTPVSGPVATQVTITGTNFSATPASNTVMFNGTTATVTASTTISITTSVPAGATTGKISVTVAGNTATSASNFTVSAGATITFTKQPQPTMACAGATATLDVTATGTTALAYQWQFATSLNGAYVNVNNDANYSGATTNTLDITTQNAFGAGFYRCEVSGNNAPTVFSDKAQLTVDNSPSCSNTPPQLDVPGISITIGNTATVALPALITDTEGNLDLSTLKIKTMPASGAHAFIDEAYNLVIDYTGVAFKGTDIMVIEVCDDQEECAEQEIAIEVSGDIVVFNAVSPNNDGKNEILFLQFVDMLPSTVHNKVTVYSRWGAQVFGITDYNNTTRVFRGLNDDGDALPTGTYFYRIDFPDEKISKTGFISLRK
jgi:gliding motility-associated-like protein